MLKTITIAENSLEPETWRTFECEDILEFLTKYFEIWPSNARIYNRNVSDVCDVTPSNEKDIENLLNIEGPVYVIVYPGWVWVPYVVMALVAVVMIASMPKVPNAAIRAGSDSPSTNNELSDRSNKSRINARIPDIFGEVRSIPDLISLSYKYFENNIEIEHSYMCIGRGSYKISDVKEETTLLSEIESASAEIYGPNTSPNSGNDPELRIGKEINLPIKKVKRFSSVANQILDPNSSSSETIFHNVTFTKDGKIVASEGSYIDFTKTISSSGSLTISSAIVYELQSGDTPEDPSVQVEIFNFNGEFSVSSVSAHEIVLASPWLTNVSWSDLHTNSTYYWPLSPFLKMTNNFWVGPFIIDIDENEQVLCNFVANNGIYADNGSEKKSFPVEIRTKIEPIDSNGNVIGAAEYFTSILEWNLRPRLNFGVTLKAKTSFVGRCKVYVRRITPKVTFTGYQIVEEVKWRDLYSVSSINKTHFGNVTTIQTLTKADDGTLGTNERKLNMLVTRKIPQRISGETFSTILYPTKRADEIIAAICLDPKIGNRNVSELDLDNIYSTIAEINSYFGTNQASEFCYTFDSALSFEETLSSVANAIFCLAYRRGSKIKLSFEKKNNIPTILFNHRNKIPGSETRSVTFGNVNDNDGVEFQYVDPTDDAIVSIYVPSDKSAVNPKIVESIGIRNFRQGHFNAMRIYNKIFNQTTCVEFEATQECNICAINDRILVSDGTRLGTFEGEVIAQNVLELELSQNVELLNGTEYTIFLQKYDGTIESIPITKTSTKNKVLLSHAPSFELVLDFNAYAKTTFVITSNDDTRKTSFILTEKKPKGVMTANLTAMNYSDLYYKNDTDYINNIIS